MTNFHAAFEYFDRLCKISFKEEQDGKTAIHVHENRKISNFLGNLNTFFRVGDSLTKLAHRGKALYEMSPTSDSGIAGSTKSFSPQITYKSSNGSLQDIYGMAILAQFVVRCAQVVVCHHS